VVDVAGSLSARHPGRASRLARASGACSLFANDRGRSGSRRRGRPGSHGTRTRTADRSAVRRRSAWHCDHVRAGGPRGRSWPPTGRRVGMVSVAARESDREPPVSAPVSSCSTLLRSTLGRRICELPGSRSGAPRVRQRVGLFVGLFCQPTSGLERFIAVGSPATISARSPVGAGFSCKRRDAGGGTRTPDTRIMIPLL
jgi:hypothetical protein